MKVLVFIERSDPCRYWGPAVPLLLAKGIDVHFVSLRPPGPLTDAVANAGIPTLSLEAQRSWDYPVAALRLANYQRKERFDIIHASESIPASISGVARYASRHPVRLFHRHHNECPQKTLFFHNLANRTADFVMACSIATGKYAHEVDGVDAKKVMAAHNGIEPLRAVRPEELAAIRSRFGIGKERRIIAIVSRLREEKGHLTLFEAAEKAAQTLGEELSVIVTGSGYYEKEIRDAATRFASIDVYFSGHQEDIAPWFAIGDVVAMPSYSEPFGLAAIEAMSCGRPLIASGVDGLLEVVENGVSGLLVPPKDDSALAEAIVKILSQPEYGLELGENGKQRVSDKFTMERMVEGWIRCYEVALQR